MRRRDVAICIAAALLFLLYIAITPSGTSTPIGRYVVDPGLRYWYVGTAAIAASLILRWRAVWPMAARVLGVIGVTWVTFFAGYYGLLILILVLAGPMGY